MSAMTQQQMEQFVADNDESTFGPVLTQWLQTQNVQGWQRANIADEVNLTEISPVLFVLLNPVIGIGYTPTYKDVLSAIDWQRRDVDKSVAQALRAGLKLMADEAEELKRVYGCSLHALLEAAVTNG